MRHQLHCNFTLNTEAFSESQFKNLEHFQLTNTQVKSEVFDDFILRFSKLKSLNLDDNHIEMVKNVPGTVEKFSILHNPLNICTQETIMSIINMKRMIRSYRAIRMKCDNFSSEMTPEEAFVEMSRLIKKPKVLEN